MDNKEKVFVDGLRFERPREGAPEFVKGRIGIKVADLQKFLEDHGKSQEWLNADLLENREGKLYFQLNTWKPTPKVEGEKPDYPEGPSGDIPF